MPAFQGTVEAISVKEMPSPDKFDNTHRASFKIGDDWFSYGSIKNGKPGEIWTKSGMITKGCELELMYDQNGDFKNVKKATVSILKKGASNEQTQGTAGSAAGTKSSFNSNVVGMSVGAAMNQAAALHAKDKTLDFDKIEKTAIQMYKIAEGLKAAAEKGSIEGAVVEQSAPQGFDVDNEPPF